MSSAGTNVKELDAIEEEIGRITNELSLLATFTRLNYTSFVKILKKHDKRTDFMLKPTFMLRLNSKPLYLENVDSLVYRLSKLYDKIRSRLSGDTGLDMGEDASSLIASTAQTFVRKTSKYWVHAENVTAVKCAVLKHLPVLIFPTKRRKIDLAVSSVYLDDDALTLYKGRLEKSEGAMAIRIRWYGSEDPQEVWIERKVHREDWTGEVSVKSRFLLKEKHVATFLSGEYKAEDLMAKLRRTGEQSEEEIKAIGQLAAEIQEAVLKMGLSPRIRTFYNRTAFQLPGDARVRISLDTDLVMVREDGPGRSGKSWKRLDIGTTDFDELRSKEIHHFPHAILEVKLQTQAGQEVPAWVQRLVDGPLVEEVPKFSKYLHGCATLLQSGTSALPYWFPQLGTDIRKALPAGTHISESSGTASVTSTHEDTVIDILDNKEDVGLREREPLLRNTKAPAAPSRTTTPHPSVPSRPQAQPQQQGDKRIHVPVRVEPKVFFANERTFLSWIHFSIFLGGISTALVGFGNRNAKISGYIFAFTSILFTLYALYLYHWRAERIRQRDPGPYDDRMGPNFVVIVFVLAMTANILFTAASAAF